MILVFTKTTYERSFLFSRYAQKSIHQRHLQLIQFLKPFAHIQNEVLG